MVCKSESNDFSCLYSVGKATLALLLTPGMTGGKAGNQSSAGAAPPATMILEAAETSLGILKCMRVSFEVT